MKTKYVLWIVVVFIAVRYGLKKESQEEEKDDLPAFFEASPIPPTFSAGTILEIKRIDASVLDKNGIGNEWSFQSEINGSRVFPNQSFIIDLSGLSELDIQSTAIDDDPTHDDVGVENLRITPQNLSRLLEEGRISESVEVFEHHGPGAGKSAICQFVYEIKRKGEKEEP